MTSHVLLVKVDYFGFVDLCGTFSMNINYKKSFELFNNAICFLIILKFKINLKTFGGRLINKKTFEIKKHKFTSFFVFYYSKHTKGLYNILN
jgi:hypothetical protein